MGPTDSFSSSMEEEGKMTMVGHVVIDEGRMDALASQLRPEEIAEKATRVKLPLKFDSPLQELNFHALASLLSFGSHYNDVLMEGSARDTVLFGLIGLHISKNDLSASLLVTTTRSDVSAYFCIDPLERVPHESSPAIHIERPGRLSALVESYQKVMSQTGEKLRELGARDLATFLLAALRVERTVACLVRSLGEALPHFDPDMVQSGQGGRVRLHRKALMLAGELWHRMRESVPETTFEDYAWSPGYVTTESVNHLIRAGVLKDADGGAEGLAEPDKWVCVLAAATLAVNSLSRRLVLPAIDVSYVLDGIAREAHKGDRGEGSGSMQAEEAIPRFVPPPDQAVI